MKPLNVAHTYFNAWNNHDAAGIVACFAEGGAYTDPSTGGPLTGSAIGDYAAGLWAAFPDLSFEIVSAAPAGDQVVAGQWIMRGTNHGSMNGLPPTGRQVELPGADFITVEGDKIRSVVGYFDSRAVPQQLGLQIVVQPHAAGPFTFGTAVSVQTGKRTKPGAFSITALQLQPDHVAEELELVRNYSRPIAVEMLNMEGFISFVGVTIAGRMVTITAWENADNPRQLMQGGTHQKAMETFYGPDHFSGGATGVYIPERINTMWTRCPACGQMVSYEQQAGVCRCGQPLPEHPPYF
jgi:steroid delta-isomerase-like uncharacterized protein